jgi:hypothetical protein
MNIRILCEHGPAKDKPSSWAGIRELTGIINRILKSERRQMGSAAVAP